MSEDATAATRAAEELRQSFSAGKTRSRAWRISQLKALQKLVVEGRDQLCRALNADLHKSTAEGYFTEVNLVEQEIQHALDRLDSWMAPTQVSTNVLNLPGSSCIYKDPLGVVLIIGAWNYPVQLSLSPLVGAIAAGNCVVVKVPSDKYSAHSSRVMSQLITKYMDQSCIRALEGDRVMTQAVLAEKWDKIFFTGGAYVGKMVAESAARHLTPVVLELGGKSPCIVDKSADLSVAALRFSWGAFMNAGQTCIRPDYLLVHEDVADRFVKEMATAVEKMYTKNQQSTEWFGRLINKRAHQRVVQILEKDKPFVKFGGQADENDLYVAPTLLDFGSDVDKFVKSASMEEEIFAPIVPMLRYRSLDFVVDFVNSRDKPLACYVFSSTAETQNRMLTETSSGCCVINDTMMQMSNCNLPFGGVGKSGMGSYHGDYSFSCFTHNKSVLKKPFILDAPIRYPPYSSFTVRVLEFLQRPRSHSSVVTMKYAFVAVLFGVLATQRHQVGSFLLFVAGCLQKAAQFLQQ
eukprot:c87_g1_i1.p1 GENE.c87_g1_i1~~c87_g1_i1.p1  ORF type:complete len:520 (-),score=128.81 c87_g1_i1:28-1587(-)